MPSPVAAAARRVGARSTGDWQQAPPVKAPPCRDRQPGEAMGQRHHLRGRTSQCDITRVVRSLAARRDVIMLPLPLVSRSTPQRFALQPTRCRASVPVDHCGAGAAVIAAYSALKPQVPRQLVPTWNSRRVRPSE